MFVIVAVVSIELRRTSDWTIWITELSICRLLICDIFVVWENNPSLRGYCISPSVVFVVRGKQSEFLLGVRWSEFRCWNHVESSWGWKTFLWFFRFPEFLDCRSHELAYRAHSTFRPVHPEQVLNNTIIQHIFFSRSYEFTNRYKPKYDRNNQCWYPGILWRYPGTCRNSTRVEKYRG